MVEASDYNRTTQLGQTRVTCYPCLLQVTVKLISHRRLLVARADIFPEQPLCLMCGSGRLALNLLFTLVMNLALTFLGHIHFTDS